MLLSPKYNFLFVHIAKTGGTSIRAALNRYRWRDPRYVPIWLASRMSALAGHRLGIKLARHARIIAAREVLPGDFFCGLYKFAFVRNPWDLQVSSYHHVRRERPDLIAACKNFSDFVHYKFAAGARLPYHLAITSSPQLEYCVDMHGHMLLDFVGRFERLDADFTVVCARLGLPKLALPHRRQARSRTDYRSYYDAETAEIVARAYASDTAHFGYRFDPDG